MRSWPKKADRRRLLRPRPFRPPLRMAAPMPGARATMMAAMRAGMRAPATRPGPRRRRMLLSRTDTIREFAPAKINLCLHVTGQRPDGYHLLDSLVIFAGIGDWLEATAAPAPVLALSGPFGPALPGGMDNLVMRAAAAVLPGRPLALRLEKHLPPASGIGGGSSDAAAAIRAALRLAPPGAQPDEAAILSIAAGL